MYYIGIDGGGTNSRLIGTDEKLNILGDSIGGSTNLCSNSYETVKSNIKALIDSFNQKTNTSISDCLGICIGSAGIDTVETKNRMENLLRELGFSGIIKVVNDGEIILAAETKGKSGVCVISGTGSIAFGLDDQGVFYRTGGLGHIIDDGGSGYRIGMEAIKSSLMSIDGRGKETSLVNRITEHFKLESIDEVLDKIYCDTFQKQKVAELSIVVKEEAENFDVVALDIEKNAAKDLFIHVDALIKRMNLSKPKIFLSGSVILKNQNIRKEFFSLVKSFYDDAQIQDVNEKPEMGALYLAMNHNFNPKKGKEAI